MEYLVFLTNDLVTAGYLESINHFDPEKTYLDIILVSGDAYVDHPSFGISLIGRVLQDAGFSVGIISQPSLDDISDIKRLGRPRLFFGISSGNIDSMLHHYTANKKKRSDDPYTEGGKSGKRPDRAVIVYSNLVKRAYKRIPVVIGGIEASMRRVVHYDYWTDSIRRSILVDSKSNILVFGMGERQVVEIAKQISQGVPIGEISDIPGTSVIVSDADIEDIEKTAIWLPSYDEILNEKLKFNEAFLLYQKESNPYRGRAVLQKQGNRTVKINPPAITLSKVEMDHIYSLPFTKKRHPSYTLPVPALETVKWSVVSHRGCYGGCSFCAIYFHQGPVISSRSENSIYSEILAMSKEKDFRGTITDIGGPTANMYETNCKRELRKTSCDRISCLYPSVCRNLSVDQGKIVKLWDHVKTIKGLKHLFVASGVRFDLALRDKNYLKILIQQQTGGHLKIAPEHVVDSVLKLMNKPPRKVFDEFLSVFNEFRNKKQFVVPYMISSHPGCTLKDMKELSSYMEKHHLRLEQAQDFIPLPMTLATAIFYTGRDPYTKQPVFVEKSASGKLKQRQVLMPKNSKYKKYAKKSQSRSLKRKK